MNMHRIKLTRSHNGVADHLEALISHDGGKTWLTPWDMPDGQSPNELILNLDYGESLPAFNSFDMKLRHLGTKVPNKCKCKPRADLVKEADVIETATQHTRESRIMEGSCGMDTEYLPTSETSEPDPCAIEDDPLVKGFVNNWKDVDEDDGDPLVGGFQRDWCDDSKRVSNPEPKQPIELTIGCHTYKFDIFGKEI